MGTATETVNVEEDGNNSVLDIDAINREITEGAQAGYDLEKHAEAGGLWALWYPHLLGFRAMVLLCRQKTGQSVPNADVNKREMARMMSMSKYEIYARHFWGIEPKKKRLRSDAYKMIDHLHDINDWFNGNEVSNADRLAWCHPSTIAKHCPSRFLKGGLSDNQPKTKKPAAGKKMTIDPEVERLRRLCHKLMNLLLKYDPKARKFLAEIDTPDDPNDSVADIGSE